VKQIRTKIFANDKYFSASLLFLKVSHAREANKTYKSLLKVIETECKYRKEFESSQFMQLCSVTASTAISSMKTPSCLSG
jgi:hypothetical protein